MLDDDRPPPECGSEWAIIFLLVAALLMAGVVIGVAIIGPVLLGD